MNKPRATRPFSDAELEEMRAIYAEAALKRTAPRLVDFCAKYQRHRQHVARKARQLGIQLRPVHGKAAIKNERDQQQAEARRLAAAAKKRSRLRRKRAEAEWKASPLAVLMERGRRTEVAKNASRRSRESWLAKTEDERRAITAKQKQTMLRRYGTGAVNRPERSYTRGVGGIRADLGIYVRSTWEANWARYLNLGIANGIVEWWKYEPQTFTFPEGADDEVRSYTPDFLVRMADGLEVYHEVKGWLIAHGRRAIELMRATYPEVALRVFTRRDYQEMTRRWRDAIPEWEHCPAATRRKLAREQDARRNRECRHCGKSFKVSTKARVFCSGECSKRAQCIAHCEKQRAKTNATRPTHGQCEWCGNEFEIGKMGRVRRLCSSRCQISRWRSNRRSIYGTA